MQTTNLVNDVGSMMNPSLYGKLAGALGTSTNTTGEAARTGIATLVGGLSEAGRTEGGADRIMNLIHAKHYDEANTFDRLGGGDPRALAEEGRDMLPAIFGNKLDSVVSGVGDSAHLPGSTAGGLLSMLTPFVMGAVGKHVREDHLDGRGLTSMLGSQRSFVSGMLPDRLTSALGMRGRTIPEYAQPQPLRRETVPAQVRGVRAKRNLSWLWVLLPLAALAVLAFNMFRNRGPAETERVVTSRAVPNSGIEGFTQALTTTGAALPATFVIDDLRFANGSAELAGDQNSIDRIADALKASPTARVRIDGYGDATGNEADNAQLSQDRANTVRAALIDNGIADDRIEARGRSAEGAAVDQAGEGRTELVLLQR